MEAFIATNAALATGILVLVGLRSNNRHRNGRARIPRGGAIDLAGDDVGGIVDLTGEDSDDAAHDPQNHECPICFEELIDDNPLVMQCVLPADEECVEPNVPAAGDPGFEQIAQGPLNQSQTACWPDLFVLSLEDDLLTKGPDAVVRLACDHAFHAQCILDEADHHIKCPICRRLFTRCGEMVSVYDEVQAEMMH